MKIYLDFDGPILNIKRKTWEVHFKVVQELGGVIKGDIDHYWSLKRDGIKRAIVLENYGIHASQEAEYLKKYISIVETEPYLAFDIIVPGAIETLKVLSSQHQLVLVTLRKNVEATKKQLNDLQLTKYFTHISIGGENPCESKVEAKTRMIKEDVKKTGLKGALFVGDSDQEILAAKVWGIPSVAVLNGFRSEKYLRRYNPTYLIKDISALPGLLERIVL